MAIPTFRERTLAMIQGGQCPQCPSKMNLQSKKHGVVWYCPGCRSWFIESEWISQLAPSQSAEKPKEEQDAVAA